MDSYTFFKRSFNQFFKTFLVPPLSVAWNGEAEPVEKTGPGPE